MRKIMIGLLVLLGVAGCSSTNMLDKRYVSVRPAYGDNALPNAGAEAPAPHVEIINPDPSRPAMPVVEDVESGTWTFTTPPTTTRVAERNGAFNQFSLFSGRPGPAATPLVVITVSPDARSQAEADPDTYKVTNTRTYPLNGSVAKEWVGTMKNGAAFSELIISRPLTKGEVCHAVAIAKTAEERKVALAILGSITWKANAAIEEGAPAKPSETPGGE